MKRRYTVICEWSDSHVFDADEIRVWADSAEGAIDSARARWSATKGAKWPSCRLEKVWVLPKTGGTSGEGVGHHAATRRFDGDLCPPERHKR